MIVSKKNISRSRSRSHSRSRSRGNNGYLKSKLVGGFLRSGTPQFSVYSGTNPLTRYAPYEVLNNANGQKCQSGGGSGSRGGGSGGSGGSGGGRKSKSNINKKQSTIYYKYM
jgi:hypothetical protein